MRTYPTAAIAAILFSLLATSGCGEDAGPSRSSAPAAASDGEAADGSSSEAEAPVPWTAPCTLFSEAAIRESAPGVTFTLHDKEEKDEVVDGTDFREGTCKYQLEGDPTKAGVAKFTMMNRNADFEFSLRKRQHPELAVKGVGDEAYWDAFNSGSSTLHVRIGDARMSIHHFGLPTPDGEDETEWERDVSIKLGKLIVAKLQAS